MFCRYLFGVYLWFQFDWHAVARKNVRYIERVGFFNPKARGQEEELRLDEARIEYWMSKGAQPSERVAHLIKGAAKAAA